MSESAYSGAARAAVQQLQEQGVQYGTDVRFDEVVRGSDEAAQEPRALLLSPVIAQLCIAMKLSEPKCKKKKII